MKTLRYLQIVLMVLAALTLAACGGGGGGGGGGGDVGGGGGGAADVVVSGQVIQGPVDGATVFADSNDNVVLDTGEVSTTSGADGSFSLTIPADYGAYYFVSVGGIDTISGRAGMTMLAPAGAANITPITTLVALTPVGPERDQLIAQLNVLSDGNGYDSNPSDPAGVAPDFLTLTKAIEEILFVMRGNGVSQTSDLLHIVEEIAKSVNETPTALTDGLLSLSDLMERAAGNVSSPTISVPSDVLADLFNDLTTGVENTINAATDPGTGTVVENEELTDAIDATNNDLIAANAVITTISQLPATANLTLANAATVAQARTAYNNLNDAAKQLVSNLNILVAAEEQMVVVQAMADAQTVVNAINNLPALEPGTETTLTTQTSAVTAAQAAFDGLSVLAQPFVTNLDTLTAAQARIGVLQTALTEAQGFGSSVNALPETLTLLLDAQQVEDVRAAFVALSAEAQAFAGNLGFLNILVAAEATIAELKTAVAATIYATTPLPGLDDNSFSAGVAIGATMAAGYAADADGAVKAVRWDLTQQGLDILELPPLLGNTYSAAYGINIDRIVGESGDEGDSTTVAVIWNGGDVSELLTSYGTSAAYSINNSGAIVGEAVDNGDTVAIYWPSATATVDQVVTLANLVEPGASAAYFINDAGTDASIVGESRNAQGFMQAVVWPLTGTTPGAPIALEEIDDQVSSVAFGVNSDGYIVGEAELTDGTVVGVLWISIGEVATIADASAQAINNTLTGSGAVVVGHTNPVSNNGLATVWNAGFPADNQQIFDEGHSLALGVNDDGHIIGVANGQAFITMPVDE